VNSKSGFLEEIIAGMIMHEARIHTTEISTRNRDKKQEAKIENLRD